MTGPIIRSKKCNRLRQGFGGRGLALTASLWALAAVDALGATALPKLPVIQSIGVVPLQWEGETKGFADARQNLGDVFPKVVRESRRFRVLGDDLVASLWKDAAGREELRGEFELSGFVGLTASPRGDVVLLTSRLMDGWLKSNLLETDTVSKSWLQNADESQVEDRLQKLVFRLFNRLPVDVSVTSVQGSYVTLSGGAEQGIEAGDKIDLIRATVKTLHPANGTWLDFNKRPLGKAQVIEVKSFTAVARLTDQVRDNLVEVGDGARVPAIASRVKFARLADNEGFKDAGEPGTIIVPPLYQGDQPKSKAPPQKPKAAPPAGPDADAKVGMLGPEKGAEPQPADDAAPTEDTAPKVATAESDVPKAEAASEPAESGPSVWDEFTTEATSHKLIDDVTAYFGPQWWSVKTKTSPNSSGRFPLYLLNSFGGGLSRTMFYKIKASFSGGLMFGQTPASSYIGYDAGARMYWEDEVNFAEGFLRYWRAGGASRLNGLSVPKGEYGGGDWIRGGVFGGLGGSLIFGEDNRRYDWFGDFTLMAINIGRVGYESSFKGVESAFGTKLSLGAYRWEPARIIQWGGGLDYSDERQTLKNGRRPHFNEYSLKLLVKYGL